MTNLIHKPRNEMTKQEKSDWFRLIGRIGGQATKKRYGRKHYVEIGEKGGNKRLSQIGNEGYGVLGKMKGRSEL